MLSKAVVRVVDKQTWLDTVGKALDSVATVAFDQLGSASKKFEDLLHGTPMGHPVHPIIIVVPLGAWTMTAALDIAGMEEGADLTLNIGLVGALSAAISGIADWRYTKGTTRRVGTTSARQSHCWSDIFHAWVCSGVGRRLPWRRSGLQPGYSGQSQRVVDGTVGVCADDAAGRSGRK
jgi:hypothetical protein